jgi:hypothetical protein
MISQSNKDSKEIPRGGRSGLGNSRFAAEKAATFFLD